MKRFAAAVLMMVLFFSCTAFCETSNTGAELKAVAAAAQAALSQDDPETALSLLKKLTDADYPGAKEQFDDAAENLYLDAQAAAGVGDYASARDQYAVLKQYNYADSADKHYEMSYMHDLQNARNLAAAGDLEKAVPELDRLVSMGVYEAVQERLLLEQVQVGLANDMIFNGQYAEAFTAFDRLVMLGFETAAEEKDRAYADLQVEIEDLMEYGEYKAALDRAAAMSGYDILDAQDNLTALESRLMFAASDLFDAGQYAEALEMLFVADDYENPQAVAMYALKVAELRNLMRSAMVRGDMKTAQKYYDIIFFYRPDIEAPIEVDDTKPTDMNATNMVFNAEIYRASDPAGLAELDEEALYRHWCDTGLKEGRMAGAVIDFAYYIENNPDVYEAYVIDGVPDYTKILNHYWTYGILEGRNPCATFNALDYMLLNPDVAQAYDHNIYKCVQHYIQFGFAENRTAVINWQ